jgi:hypothetical protein
VSDGANGAALLAALVGIARLQSAALAADDLEEMGRLAEQREPLGNALATADWTERAIAQALGRDLARLDRENEAALRRLIEETKRERANVTRGTRALHGYAGSTKTPPVGAPSLLDRSA